MSLNYEYTFNSDFESLREAFKIENNYVNVIFDLE